MKDHILSIRLGAIYRLAADRNLSRQVVEELLTIRAGLSGRESTTLACHWFTTERLRK